MPFLGALINSFGGVGGLTLVFFGLETENGAKAAQRL
jgi:hypothetical protein